MVEPSVARSMWSSSAEGWVDLMRKGDLNRELLLDAPMLDLAGDVAGQRVLDVGCGEGRFSRFLSARGASVVGIDPTPGLLAESKRQDPSSRVLRASGEALPFANDAFDLVVAYLVLIDIPDFRAGIQEISRVLRPGGQVIVANLNSFTTTNAQAWFKDVDGRRLHVRVDEYFEERAILLKWAGIEIFNWHRPMEAYMQAFLGAGLTLEAFAEPRPTPEVVAEHPGFAYNLRVPLFHTMAWRK